MQTASIDVKFDEVAISPKPRGLPSGFQKVTAYPAARERVFANPSNFRPADARIDSKSARRCHKSCPVAQTDSTCGASQGNRNKTGKAVERKDRDRLSKVTKDRTQAESDFIDVNAGIFEDKEPDYLQRLHRRRDIAGKG